MINKNIVNEILKIKKEKNAIILAHNYQLPEIQDVADITGDSLDLSIKATKTSAEVIIFCGVNFMAEAAKILNPDKTVIIPDKNASCPMAAMVDKELLEALKKEIPLAKVVSYINTTAEIKAISDICCTSANGVDVIKSLKEDKIIFVPDTNLGSYIQRFTPGKEIRLWPGICPTHHERIKKEEILDIKKEHQKAEILVHPECTPEVIDVSDHALSTNGMVNYVKESKSKEFIIGTEKELCYRLKKENPDKIFYSIKTAICPNMKKITIEKVLKSLKSLEPEITLSSEIMKKAKIPLQKMLDVGRGD